MTSTRLTSRSTLEALIMLFGTPSTLNATVPSEKFTGVPSELTPRMEKNCEPVALLIHCTFGELRAIAAPGSNGAAIKLSGETTVMLSGTFLRSSLVFLAETSIGSRIVSSAPAFA